jgi:ubiquinol-cytochrome c reductase iron-sulfur subunit
MSSENEPVTGGTGDEAIVPHRVIGTPSPAPATIDQTAGTVAEGTRMVATDPPDLQHAKRAEILIALILVLTFFAGCGFIAAYIGIEVGPIDAVLRSNLALGLTLSISLAGIGIASLLWVRHLTPNIEMVEERHEMRSSDQAREEFSRTFMEGTIQSQVTKRPLLRRTMLLATAPLALLPIVLLRDLGPLPGTSLRHTAWKRGTRLVVYGTNQPLTPADMATPGSMITVIPEGVTDPDELAKAGTIIIKFAPGELNIPTEVNGGTLLHTMNWTVDNIVAYSKICTHVGCPVALYEQTTHHILCPCHQSTFDAAHGANVIFGPAARALPQLPMTLNAQGYLVAASDYNEPVGPSFWERG